jgi:integrase
MKLFWLVELCLEKFNKECGNRIVNTGKLAALENYQTRRQLEGKAPATVDHEVCKTKTMIIKAFENDLVGGDVLKTFRRCKKTLKPGSDIRDRLINRDEFERLLSHANRHLRGILTMAYYTGMCRGENLALTWDKVDMKERAIRLTADMTKDSEARTIPKSDALYRELKAIPRAIHDNHVFLFRGKPVTHIRNGLRRACQKAEIVYGRFEEGGFVCHDLRHTFNTNMRKAGVAESVIMAITGHSKREMFDRYNRIDGDDVSAAINQFEGFLQNGPQIGPQKAVS